MVSTFVYQILEWKG